VKIVKRKENLPESKLKKMLCEAVRGIPVKKIPETVPHWFLNKAVVVTSREADGKGVQC
jgi:hypothetical protein